MNALATTLPAVDPVLSHACAAALAIVFLAGAWDKLRIPVLFEAAVQGYGLLPRWLVRPFALALPVAEIAAALLLLAMATRPAGAVLAGLLLALFAAAIGINLLRGRTDIDCGCGGAAHVRLSAGLLWRNLGLIAAAFAASCPVSARPLGVLDMVAVAGMALFGFGLYLLVNVLLAQQARLLALRRLSDL